ncbi:Heat shock (predicted periplasmic) protein YciM, precursor [hydrothermal vent metagenome]|uniref:Heat shock (Predicted periplasmic) protein YciM n=1 Tax=hydrothermal vent metagenome TaxID=652676 RepID=A0A3B0XD45_9ZZZZ
MLDFLQISPLFLTTIPIVIGFLWFLFRTKKTHKQQQSTLSSEYFKGLNYLLNDEQGKALDIFVKLVESNWDTIDTHFALGKIYRKNGEMDKAIKIHQSLIARPSLPERYRCKILLELGYDYLGAGWFDRAEGLFKEVLIQDEKSKEARHNLILIYQQEKDWFKAIDIAADIFAENPSVTGPMIAQYYCELADISKIKGDVIQLKNHANKALRYDASCVRASILLAEQEKKDGNDKKAIMLYEAIEKQDPESVILVIDSMLECYKNLSSEKKLYEYLVDLQNRHENLFLQTMIVSVLEKSQCKQAAIEYLSGKIKTQPSLEGIQKLVAYKEKETGADEIFADLTLAISMMQKDNMGYRCQKCGFSTNTHYWLCPSCNHWARVKPSVIEHENNRVVDTST